MRFAGRTAVVTGASRGLGRAMAVAFASEGAYVLIAYRSREADASETLRQVQAIGRGEILQLDVTRPEEVQAAFQKIEADVLVNNAGLSLDGPFALMDRQSWREVLEVNLDGVFHCTKGALPAMLRKKRGAIVNVASVAGMHASPGQANYAAAKGGLIALTRTLAAELAPKGIRVNAVVPGLCDAGMAQHLDRRIAAHLKEVTPLGRFGRAEEISRAVLFLASDDASYIVGHALVVDGGLTL